MYRTIKLVAAGALLVAACANERVGMQTYPIGSVDSDGDVLQAVKHALPPDEQACALELLTAEDSWKAAESTSKEIVSVKVCGRSQDFSIQRIHQNADSVLIVAKKLK
jgi:hypothetical protein